MNSWKILVVIAVVGLLALVGLMATIAFAGPRTPQFAGWGPGGMMGTYGGGMMGGYNGMMGPGPMGPGMMGLGFGGASQVDPLSVEDARAAVETYLARLGNPPQADLAAGEVMVFSNHAYGQVVEKSTGAGAFEVLVDPVTRAVTPEPGPNIMWNLKYGPMASFGGPGMMMGGYQGYGTGRMMDGVTPAQPSAEMPVSPDQAIQTAQLYLEAYLPGTQAEDEADRFYGYYTIHVLRNGGTVGMLSVNGYTQEVFVHFWHGEFVDMAE